jgi:hypothetical protein
MSENTRNKPFILRRKLTKITEITPIEFEINVKNKKLSKSKDEAVSRPRRSILSDLEESIDLLGESFRAALVTEPPFVTASEQRNRDRQSEFPNMPLRFIAGDTLAFPLVHNRPLPNSFRGFTSVEVSFQENNRLLLRFYNGSEEVGSRVVRIEGHQRIRIPLLGFIPGD